MADNKNDVKDDNSAVNERNTIRYKWVLSRIQGMKSLLVATIIAMVGYTASAVGQSQTYCEIVLLASGALLLVLALILAAMDAGAALFYDEKSQEGIGRKLRLLMYTSIAFAAVLILASKITMGVINVQKQHSTVIQKQHSFKNQK